MATRNSPVPAAFGAVVRRLREQQDPEVSQERLGQRTKRHRNYVGQLERGEISPALVAVFEIAQALETTPSELVRLTEDELDRGHRAYRRRVPRA